MKWNLPLSESDSFLRVSSTWKIMWWSRDNLLYHSVIHRLCPVCVVLYGGPLFDEGTEESCWSPRPELQDSHVRCQYRTYQLLNKMNKRYFFCFWHTVTSTPDLSIHIDLPSFLPLPRDAWYAAMQVLYVTSPQLGSSAHSTSTPFTSDSAGSISSGLCPCVSCQALFQHEFFCKVQN